MMHNAHDEFPHYIPQFLWRPIRLFAIRDLLIRLPDLSDEPAGMVCQLLKIGLVLSDRLRVIDVSWISIPEIHKSRPEPW